MLIKHSKKPNLECEECLCKTNKLFNDPRCPPLNTQPCLCKQCADGVYEEWVDSIGSEVREAVDNQLKIQMETAIIIPTTGEGKDNE